MNGAPMSKTEWAAELTNGELAATLEFYAIDTPNNAMNTVVREAADRLRRADE